MWLVCSLEQAVRLGSACAYGFLWPADGLALFHQHHWSRNSHMVVSELFQESFSAWYKNTNRSILGEDIQTYTGKSELCRRPPWQYHFFWFSSWDRSNSAEDWIKWFQLAWCFSQAVSLSVLLLKISEVGFAALISLINNPSLSFKVPYSRTICLISHRKWSSRRLVFQNFWSPSPNSVFLYFASIFY